MASWIDFYNHWLEYEDGFSDIATTPRSWVLNGYGRCEFSIPLDHPACNERYIRFGNFIRIKHIPVLGMDEATDLNVDPVGILPDWVGVILPPRTWKKDSVSVVAYSLESVLAYRAMPYIALKGTADQVFLQIMDRTYQGMNTNPPWRFVYEQVDPSPIIYYDDLRTNAYDHIQKLAKTVNMEWGAGATVIPGSRALQPYVYFKNKQMAAGALTLNPSNTEEQDPLLTEQGVPWNMIFAYTQSYTDADRVMQLVTNQASVDDYGPIQINQIFMGVHDAAGLASAALASSEYRGRPQRVFKRIALDVGTTFNYLRPGALALVDEPRVGFNVDGGFGFTSDVRILSMDYNDISDKVGLNVEIARVDRSRPRDMTRY